MDKEALGKLIYAAGTVAVFLVGWFFVDNELLVIALLIPVAGVAWVGLQIKDKEKISKQRAKWKSLDTKEQRKGNPEDGIQ
ncbi:MAG: hypothetical protein GX483_07025 [Actinomycetaceae bacterium]|nr:hypothetical protein [Actinomycetaceae bacterium]